MQYLLGHLAVRIHRDDQGACFHPSALAVFIDRAAGTIVPRRAAASFNRFFGGSETLEQAQTLSAKKRKEEEEFVAWEKRIAEGRLGVALRELYSVTAEFEYLGGEDAVIPPEKPALQDRWWWLRNRKTALQSRVQQG
jgi:hypothetical protein